MKSGKQTVAKIISLFSFIFVATDCQVSRPPDAVKEEPSLARHSKIFEKAVLKVTDGVHVAIGYGLANSILIEGDDGLIIIDTMESVEEGRTVLREFRKISQKPIAAIIYTHNHADHVFGSGAFAKEGTVDVYAHESTQRHLERVVHVALPILNARSARMFGSRLQGTALENAGIGPRLGMTDKSTVHVLKPNKTFPNKLSTTIAGVKLELHHAPGETPDQLFVWLPEKRILFPGDNIYKAFPNLYAIRGTGYRDVLAWVDSLDKIRKKRPAYLVPSHTRPLVGEEIIYETVTAYRDAIQFIHDQTVRGMNNGLTPDELVHFVKLPNHLAAHPYLQEFYGTVAWSVRSVFMGYLGWFDGNATTLDPLAPMEQARRYATLAGGEEALLAKAETAYKEGDYKWVLQLTDALSRLHPGSERPYELKALALRKLGEASSNPNARHYYLTRALELVEGVKPALNAKPTMEFLRSLPVEGFLQAMAVRLKAEETLDVDQALVLNFTDTGGSYTIRIRRGIAEISGGRSPHSDLELTVSSELWKEILTKQRNPLTEFATGNIKITGGKLELLKFLQYF